jgi:hypothetical protein
MIAYIRKTDALDRPWYVAYIDGNWRRCTEPMGSYSEAHAHATALGAEIHDDFAQANVKAGRCRTCGGSRFMPTPSWDTGRIHVPVPCYGCSANEQAGDRAREAIVHPMDDYLGAYAPDPQCDTFFEDYLHMARICGIL